MGILIGMDEAGYGPNFGPLVVAATAWKVSDCELRHPKGTRDCEIGNSIRNPNSEIRNGSESSTKVAQAHEIDLYRSLRRVVAPRTSERRIAIADSKILYKPGLGLRQLERGVHAALRVIGQSLSCWSAIVECCGADPDGHHSRLPWHDGCDCRLPVDAADDELARLTNRLEAACESAGVRPLAIRARLVFPGEFNELVEYYGTKGAALSHVTVRLLREVIDSLSQTGQSPTFVVCDKHGGRNYYAALLQHHFSEHWIEPVFESRAESHYEWGPAEARVCAKFCVGGESFLPTALASMTAKYLRELAMRPFNDFWCARVKDLRPTAGYPLDAQRFHKAIAAEQRALQIDDRIIWRNR